MKGFLRLRGGSYYFRCRVPFDLYGTYFKGKEILKGKRRSFGLFIRTA